jgi:hypothetical protein
MSLLRGEQARRCEWMLWVNRKGNVHGIEAKYRLVNGVREMRCVARFN